jgi:hypothetical protein
MILSTFIIFVSFLINNLYNIGLNNEYFLMAMLLMVVASFCMDAFLPQHNNTHLLSCNNTIKKL